MNNNFKNDKFVEVVQEFQIVQGQSVYQIGSIDLKDVYFFVKNGNENYKVLATGQYTVDGVNLTINDPNIILTNTHIQVCRVYSTVASKYISDVVNINTLREHYNVLVDDFINVIDFLRKSGIKSDSSAMNYVFPLLEEGQVFMRKGLGFEGKQVMDIDAELQAQIDKAYAFFEQYVNNEKKPELDAYTVSKKQELETYTIAKKGEINTLVTGHKADINTLADTKKTEIIELGNLKQQEIISLSTGKIKEITDVTTVKKQEIETLTAQKKVQITDHTDLEIQKILALGVDNLQTQINTNKSDILLKANKSDILNKENTIEDLIKSRKYEVGDVVQVLGYYSAGDGANHIRKISKTNDGSGVQLANGLWANIVHNGEVNVSWFGAKGEVGFDNSDILNKAIVYFENATSNLCINKGEYEFKKPIVFNKRIGRRTIDFKDSTFKLSQSGIRVFMHFKGFDYCVVKNINLLCYLNAEIGIHFGDDNSENEFISNSTIENIRVFQVTDIGIKAYPWMVRFTRCTVDQSRNIGFDISRGTSTTLDTCWVRQTQNIGYHIHGNHLYSSTISCGCDGSGKSDDEWLQRTKVAWVLDGVQGFTMVQSGSEQVDKCVEARNARSLFIDGYHMLGCGRTTVSEPTFSFFEFYTGNGWVARGIYGQTYNYYTNIISFNSTNTYGGEQLILLDNTVAHDEIDTSTNVNYSWRTVQLVKRIDDLGGNINGLLIFEVNNETDFKNHITSLRQYQNIDLNVKLIITTSFSTTGLEIRNLKGNGVLLIEGKTGNEVITYVGGYGITIYDCSLKMLFNNITISGGMNFYSQHIRVFSSKVTSKNVKFVAPGSCGWTIGGYEESTIHQTNCTTEGTFRRGDGSKPYVVDIDERSIATLNGNFINRLDESLIVILDTPYHARNMSKLGILDSYHNYLTELHEYEKSQNVPEGVMNLNVVQPPVIPKEIEEYAKEYNLL